MRIDAQGKRRYASDQNSGTNIPITAEAARATLVGQTIWYTATVENGQVRVEALPLHAPVVLSNGEATSSTDVGPVIGTLLVAKSLSDVNATLLVLRTLLLLAGAATVAAALLGGWVIAARVLYPLSEMAKTAQAIAATTACGTRIGNLSQRVRLPGGLDKMVQVVDAFNEMLTHLENAMQAQRRFVADASHELHAPLTTIKGNLAFLQCHVDELPEEERHTMLSDAHTETLRLARLVEEMFLLARADANVVTTSALPEKETAISGHIQQQPVELDHTVLQLVRQFHIEPTRVR